MNTLVAGAASWTENYATVSEKLFIGVTMALIGIVIVVMILALISIVVSLISRLIGRGFQPSASSRKSGSSEAALPAEDTFTKTDDALQAADDSFDHIAVIAAAIAAYKADAGPGIAHSTAGFFVRRIRRV